MRNYTLFTIAPNKLNQSELEQIFPEWRRLQCRFFVCSRISNAKLIGDFYSDCFESFESFDPFDLFDGFDFFAIFFSMCFSFFKSLVFVNLTGKN